jgi:hypothetical protein
MENNIKNILIIENTRDNQVVVTVFFNDLSEITDDNLRKAVKFAIENPKEVHMEFENNVIVSYGLIFSELGYVFKDMKSEVFKLPITVEHIVNSVF